MYSEESGPAALGEGQAEASVDGGQRGGGPWVGVDSCTLGDDMGGDSEGRSQTGTWF